MTKSILKCVFSFLTLQPTALLVLSPSHSNKHGLRKPCISACLSFFKFWLILVEKSLCTVKTLLKIKIHILLLTWERVWKIPTVLKLSGSKTSKNNNTIGWKIKFHCKKIIISISSLSWLKMKIFSRNFVWPTQLHSATLNEFSSKNVRKIGWSLMGYYINFCLVFGPQNNVLTIKSFSFHSLQY